MRLQPLVRHPDMSSSTRCVSILDNGSPWCRRLIAQLDSSIFMNEFIVESKRTPDS